MEQIETEYSNFMKWFKENHSELHEKYSRNISVPLEIGAGVGINNSYKITNEEHAMLLGVAKTYYHPEG